LPSAGAVDILTAVLPPHLLLLFAATVSTGHAVGADLSVPAADLEPLQQVPPNGGHPSSPPPTQCAWEWPGGERSGWYAGLGGGWAYTYGVDHRSGRVLSDLGFNNANLDFDPSDVAGKVFVGYRFEQPYSVEAGWLHLGRVNGDFTVPPPPPGVGGSFRDDANGWFASGSWYFHERDPWSFSAKAGIWAWDSEVHLHVPGLAKNQRSATDSGVNPFFGLTASRALSERLGARLEYEKYFLDYDQTDLLGVGLYVKF